MARTPDKAVVDVLAAAGIGLTAAVNLFDGEELPPLDGTVPHQAVFCQAMGGPPPEPYCGMALSVFQSRVQAIVRSNVNDRDGGQTLARQVLDALHIKAVTGFADCLAQQSEPEYWGADDTQHHRWSVNLVLPSEA